MMTLPGSGHLLPLMNHEIGDPYQQITAVYRSLSEPALAGVSDHVRTTLVGLVAEMRAGTRRRRRFPRQRLRIKP